MNDRYLKSNFNSRFNKDFLVKCCIFLCFWMYLGAQEWLLCCQRMRTTAIPSHSMIDLLIDDCVLYIGEPLLVNELDPGLQELGCI